MDILDILIYLIFLVAFVLNLISIILKIKNKRARGERVLKGIFQRRLIKVPRTLYYYMKNMQMDSETETKDKDMPPGEYSGGKIQKNTFIDPD